MNTAKQTNMTLSTLIADDEFHAVENLKRMIARYCPGLQVVATAGSLKEAVEMAGKYRPRAVFLDIKMPGGNTIDNFDAAAFGNAEIIFVTAYDEFAIKAIKLGALDYILKPVHPDELMQAAAKLAARFGNTAPEAETKVKEASLCVYINGGYEVIQYSDITALEALGAYTRIHTGSNKTLTSSKNIGYYSLLLHKASFCRVHKSFMINLEKVVSVNKATRVIKMLNNQLIPVSVRMLADLTSRINK
jgi:two-component system, LytTR family, response regulator